MNLPRRRGAQGEDMRRIVTSAAAVVVALAASLAGAQTARVDVTLTHTGTDLAGKRLAAVLAGDLITNKRMTLVKTSDLRIGVYLATMARGDSTIYSATWTLGGMNDDGYLTSKVGVCANDNIRGCARSLLAETDKHASVLWSMRTKQAGAR
jgi:hypothetical protein